MEKSSEVWLQHHQLPPAIWGRIIGYDGQPLNMRAAYDETDFDLCSIEVSKLTYEQAGYWLDHLNEPTLISFGTWESKKGLKLIVDFFNSPGSKGEHINLYLEPCRTVSASKPARGFLAPSFIVWSAAKLLQLRSDWDEPMIEGLTVKDGIAHIKCPYL